MDLALRLHMFGRGMFVTADVSTGHKPALPTYLITSNLCVKAVLPFTSIWSCGVCPQSVTLSDY